MKATFFERLGSYLLDAIIISIIFSIICLGFKNTSNATELQMKELDEKLIANEITSEEYLKEYTILLYDNQKKNVLQSGISLALNIAYFVVFQYMNKGKTIGKQLLKIKVVDKDSKEPISILRGFLRSLIILSILSSALLILFLYVLNKQNYFTAYATIISLEGLFTLTSAIMVLYRNDGRGLHDMMTNTMVIKESRE